MQTEHNLWEQCGQCLTHIMEGHSHLSQPVTVSDACTADERVFVEQFNRFVQQYKQSNEFINKVCQGDLAQNPPPDNRLLDSFKQLHSDLRHLVWQTQQLAAGDLNQTVYFMGDFSHSFNQLIESLKERRQLLEQVYKSEQFYRGILRIAPDHISIADMDGTVTFVSQKGLKIFGYSDQSEMLGRNLMDFLAPDQRRLAEKVMKAMIAGIRTDESVFQAVRKDGSLFWIDVNADVMVDENGKPEAMLLVIRDITQQRDMKQQLLDYAEQMYNNSRTDMMTGMLNRTEGLRVLDVELQRSLSRDYHLAVVFIDLDYLKVANDNYGHTEGDRLILEITKAMKASIRPGDITVRMGGDEFVIIMPDIRDSDVQTVIDNMNQYVKDFNESHEIQSVLSFSYGFCISGESMTCSVENLIHTADQLMYENKKTKKHRE